MKYIFILTIFLLSSFNTSNSNVKEVVDKVSHSFKKGNSELLTATLDTHVELTIESEKISYPRISSERAGMILSSFFKSNPPLSFKYLYQGNTSDDLKYCVANYTSGKDFLVYMLIKKDSHQRFVVKSLQVKES
ncbi:protein of unknown function [Spirosomataceae bacterium TFI 002]|nr:protein of unknown function [Spirosomataceae bacterium TFI 002]